MKHIGLFSLFVLVSIAPLAAAATVGDRAPEIHFDRLLPDQPLANARFDALAGKVVVLDLWATWCAPCVKAIPHHNELVEQFKDQPVIFLSVSNEEPSVVEAFLKERPMWEKRAEWLSLIAAWQLRHRRDPAAARLVLQRLIREYPDTAQAFAAQRRLNLLKAEAETRKI